MDLVRSSKGAYPSGYNMSYLNSKAAFIQGGSYGNLENSIGPFVAKVRTAEALPGPAAQVVPEPWDEIDELFRG